MFVYGSQTKKHDIGEGRLLQIMGSGANMNALHWNLPDKSIIPLHQHVHEQFGYIIKGGFEIICGDEKVTLTTGDVYYIPSNVPHQFTSIGETEAVDVFSPVRSELPWKIPDEE